MEPAGMLKTKAQAKTKPGSFLVTGSAWDIPLNLDLVSLDSKFQSPLLACSWVGVACKSGQDERAKSGIDPSSSNPSLNPPLTPPNGPPSRFQSLISMVAILPSLPT